MDSWNQISLVVIGLFVLVLLYVNIHMIYNRVKGKDELDGLFRLRIKKRNKNK